MKHFRENLVFQITVIVVLAGLLLSACAPANPGAGGSTPSPAGSTATPAAGQPVDKGQLEESPAAQAAIDDLAAQTGISQEDIRVISVEEAQWTDSCFGLGGPAESCLQVIIEGYRVILEADGQQYEYRTNDDGTQFRVAGNNQGGGQPPVGGLPEGDLPVAAVNARQELSQQLGLSPDQVVVVSVELVDWPDGCLGIQEPGMLCTQAIVPGYRVILEASGQQYEFRTDLEGGVVKLAQAPLPEMPAGVVTWEQTVDTACVSAEIGGAGLVFGPCGETPTELPLGIGRAQELAYFFTTYAPFSSETQAGTLTFAGQGDRQPTQTEQRSIAEWARLVFQEAQGEQSGLAFTWHREGGIAGFCDDMTVYLAGWALPSSCKASQPQSRPAYRLTAEELEQLYAWVDRFESFEYETKDPAAADSMTVRVVFTGSGADTATPAQQAEIAAYAARLYTNAS